MQNTNENFRVSFRSLETLDLTQHLKSGNLRFFQIARRVIRRENKIENKGGTYLMKGIILIDFFAWSFYIQGNVWYWSSQWKIALSNPGKLTKSLQQTHIFLSLYLCYQMSFTFDISNHEFCLIKKVLNIKGSNY